ncbi:MAG: rhomboid family intramembrane serine protease [Bdellovibrionota bacterium]|nr:rhomboid family intramembrane serine protease [Deltaproteobacteria bacterium]
MDTKSGMQFALGPKLTPTVKTLMVINVLVFVSITFFGHALHPTLNVPYGALIVSILGLHPQEVIAQYTVWQLLTFLFVHATFLHLLFNMLGLWWFGADLERVWGSKRFFRYFLFTGIGSGLVSLLMQQPTIGASGSIYGLLFAFGMLYPNRVIYLYFVLPIRAKYFVLLFGLLELGALVFSRADGINHWAHLGGLFFGFVWFFIDRNRISPRMLLRRYRYYKHRKRFRLIVNEQELPEESGPYVDDKNPTIH